MPTPSRHVELALYADDTALVATSRRPSLLVSYQETYLVRLQHCLRHWKIAFNVSKSAAVLLPSTARRNQNPRPVQFFREPIQWVEKTRYLRLTVDTSWLGQCTSTSSKIGRAWPPSSREVACDALQATHPFLWWTMHAHLHVHWPQSCLEAGSVVIQVPSHFEWRTLVR
jgi:hypothetical protein